MSFHWKVLLWMLAGLVAGLVMQWQLEASAWAGATWSDHPDGISLSSKSNKGPVDKAKISEGTTFRWAVRYRGSTEEPLEERIELDTPKTFQSTLDRSSNGEVVWLFRTLEDRSPVAVALVMDPTCSRAQAVAPFSFLADIFMQLLKMLIVPLVLSSIVTGVAGVGTMKDLRRLGGKTFLYYVSTSLLAIVVGQFLVNVVRPGEDAVLGLPLGDAGRGTEDSFIAVLKRMVPENVFTSFGDNGAMLSIIFFALLLGFFITQAAEPHSTRIRDVFTSFFEVMMKMAEGILKLLPYGVFCLIVRVTASTGIAPFKALLLYMFTVALALAIHFAVTLPLLLKFVGGINPLSWFKAMSPALMTAFSTSSSSMTLPVTLKAVEHRGRVSNKVTSFTLPLGATINMDGTALYECIGVVFLAQYYATIGGDPLSIGQQALIVLLALLASVGAAGIPSAGLVMMLTILAALKLPVEGAALLLAVDRPLDMMRTVVNVWSDSCGAAVIARTEGEAGPLDPVVSG